MKVEEKWKVTYFTSNCIKEVDEQGRRLLIQLPNCSVPSRIWVSMKSVQFVNSAGNGTYRKLFYKESFNYKGYEIVGNYRHELHVSGTAITRHFEHMNRGIKENIQSAYDADIRRRKRYDQQKGRY